jgi:hypothetical protein
LIDAIFKIIESPLFTLVLLLAVIAALGYLYTAGSFSGARAAIAGLFAQAPRKTEPKESFNSVVQDWTPTGYIDFSVPYDLRGATEREHEAGFFHLTVEEHRLIKTIGGSAAVERRWRRASLAEARETAANYYVFLQEHPEKASSDDPRKTATVSAPPTPFHDAAE